MEEGILAGIRERGFELIPFEDHIAFRYAYETKFRSRWDRGEQTEQVVVLHSEARDLNCLPYDLLQAGRRLSFSLGEIFLNLSYPVVAALDRRDLDALGLLLRVAAGGMMLAGIKHLFYRPVPEGDPLAFPRIGNGHADLGRDDRRIGVLAVGGF